MARATPLYHDVHREMKGVTASAAAGAWAKVLQFQAKHGVISGAIGGDWSVTPCRTARSSWLGIGEELTRLESDESPGGPPAAPEAR